MAPAPTAPNTPSEPESQIPPSEPRDPRGERAIAFDIDQVISSESAPTGPAVGYGVVSDTPFARNPTHYDVSTVIGARARLASLELDGEVPFVLMLGGGGLEGAVFGNVALAAYYLHDLGHLRFRIGGILSLPTSPAALTGSAPYPLNFGLPAYYGTPAGSVGTTSAIRYRGFDRAWLWANHYFTPIAPSARIASNEESVFQHATEVVVAPLVGIDPGASVTVAAQLSEEVGAHLSSFRGGGRFEAVSIFGPGDPSVAITVAPFAALESKLGFGEISPILSLHEWKFESDNSTLRWGLRLRGGFYF